MRHVHKENGVVMVEFALVLPVLLALLFGIFSFGLALNAWIEATHLSSEAARYAAVDFNPGPGPTLQASIQQQAGISALREGGTALVPDPARVCISFPTDALTGSSGHVGDPVEATTSVKMNLLPFIGSMLGRDEITITSSARMRIEAVPRAYTGGCT